MRAMIQIKRLYPHCKVLRNQGLEPGDLLVVGPPGGGPGHAMIVGWEPNTLWHCIPQVGVERSGWALVAGQQRIFRAYRAINRSETWNIPVTLPS